MAPHSSTLAWRIPWTEEPGGLQPMGSQSQRRLSDFTFTFHFHAIDKEMATHSSVLAWRIPGTGEPWWAAVYGVPQSRTRLKRLSSRSKLSYLVPHWKESKLKEFQGSMTSWGRFCLFFVFEERKDWLSHRNQDKERETDFTKDRN